MGSDAEGAQTVDGIGPSSPQSKFYIGVASFQVAARLANELQEQAKAAQKSNKERRQGTACRRPRRWKICW